MSESIASTPVSWREILTSAIGYWEPLRLLYNVVLAAVVVNYFALAWPASREALTLDAVTGLLVLAALANICYCAAYLPDFVAQASGFRETWLRWRWTLFAVGLAFGAILARAMTLAFLAAAKVGNPLI